ncbi:response regulator [Candidatus Amarolinea aalborgensis]|jgi:DNA-binding NarL/FixJ family response regulator|uniref:response regulator transcription factor n=1 Tax=Candidatus Amarolinea aalborgensis TaxID=2249329 RepID=UPI003BF944D2
MSPIRLILADDHVMLRQGTLAMLARETDLAVVGEANDGAEAVRLAEMLRPDVVVMDVRMPGMNGIEATRQIRTRLPNVQVLVLTAHDDDEYVFALLEAGANGYLLKTAPVSELVHAIRAIAAGESAMAPSIVRKLVNRVSGRKTAQPEDEFEALTSREMEVLKLLAQGMTNKQIADTLIISDRTVQTHLSNIFGKLGVNSRTEAILMAMKRNLLRAP